MPLFLLYLYKKEIKNMKYELLKKALFPQSVEAINLTI